MKEIVEVFINQINNQTEFQPPTIGEWLAWFGSLPTTIQLMFIAMLLMPVGSFVFVILIRAYRNRNNVLWATIWLPDRMLDSFWVRSRDMKTFVRKGCRYILKPEAIGLRRFKKWLGLRTQQFYKTEYIHNQPMPLMPDNPAFKLSGVITDKTGKVVHSDELEEIVTLKVLRELGEETRERMVQMLTMLAVIFSLMSVGIMVYLITQIQEIRAIVGGLLGGGA